MIKTEAEYNSSLEFLNRDMELYDFDLSKKMTSEEYNLYLQDVEYYLIFLYEKTRTLEDVIDYVEWYGTKKIDALNKLFDDNLEILKSAIDKYVDSDAITIKPSWTENPLTAITDRDGTILSVLKKDSKGLMVSNAKIYDIPVKSVTKTSNYNSYNDNIDSCLKDNYYVSCYNLDQPDTIIEELALELDGADNINYCYIEPMNCDCSLEFNNNNYTLIITAQNSNKEYENFSYDNFIASNLDSVKTLNMVYNSSLPINDNQNKLADLKDMSSKNHYMNEVLRQQKLAAEQFEKSNKLNAVEKGQIWLS